MFPSQYRKYMLKPTCSSPECRKPDVTRRQYSLPRSIAGPQRAKSLNTCEPPLPPPVSTEPPIPDPRNISTLIAMSTYVAVGSACMERSECTFCLRPAQSGQRMPTGVGVMQSGQIGLPQLEHETPVWREGCR